MIGGFAGFAHAQTTDPQPSGASVSGLLPAFQQWVDAVVPSPALPNAPDTPLVDAGGLAPGLAALRAGTLPTPIGDSFVDEWPARLDDFGAGQLVAWRDVTATAGPALITPVRQVVQLKYRTTDSHGAASYAIASLALPPGQWTGAGERPVVVNNLPINSLGRDCNPSYTLAHGFSSNTNLAEYLPPTTQLALLRGYAVLIADHEGPRMAYAEPFVAGHAVLDAIRAVRGSMPKEFGESRFGMVGYSGGAIATKGAVKLMADYAPELVDVVVGAAMGGVPADYEILSRSMNANLASGVFMAATFAIGRERPEILAHMNHLAQWVAVIMKDTCMDSYGIPGILQLPIDIAANFPDPLHSQLAEEVYRVTRMDGMKSPVPLYIYNGAQEFWIPSAGAENLYAEQCALGVTVVYRSVAGEHIVAAFTGFPESLIWLDQRLRGEPAPNEC
ncbi:lipase [Nocardia sp. SYP-A9097]|nr:lipase [Nocardia sp. SYP-A9097]